MRRFVAILVLVLLALAGCGREDEGDRPAAGPADTGAETGPCAPDEREPPSAPPAPPRGVPKSLLGREWEVLPTSRKIVALTFDCGANAAGVRSIAATLERADAPATFFLTGRWAETFPEAAAQLARRYPVGNHTYSHADLTTLGDAAARAEIRRAERVIERVTGRDPRPFFRFPYGARDERTIGLVNGLGYGSIRWTVDTLGWQGTAGGRSVASVRSRVLDALRPGAIVLMHVGAAPDGSTLDADALPGIIAAIRTRGYRLVDLGEFLD
jgi:peptidoglycan/xylan/chitin deacetylase (PgdA/CDA1 family)